MRKKVAFLTLALVVALALPMLVLAQAGWSEDFDSYPTGQDLHGVGGWKGWGNDPTFTALTSDVQAHSAPNSVDINGLSDLVHEFAGYDSGMWTITAWQYIPANMVGQTYYIWLNQYDDPGTTNNWSVQVNFDSATGMMTSEFDGATLPYTTDAWAELVIEVDLDGDTQTFYYDGTMLYTKSWADGVSGGGIANIGAIDLFANGATTVYYDDISIVPTFGISVTKTPASQTIVSGGTANWTIEVTNDGATDLENVSTSDAMAADCEMLIGALASGDSVSYTCSEANVTSSFTNTVVATGGVVGGPTFTATASAYVEVVPPTSVSLSSFGAEEVGVSWVFALAAGLVGVGVIFWISRRRRAA